LSVGGLGLPPATFLAKPAPGAGTKVVTRWVTWPVPSDCGGMPSGVPVPVKLLVTLVPLGKVALGKVTFTWMSQLPPGMRGTAQGLVQVTVAGVVPSQPGSQSAAGEALLKTVPVGSVSTMGPMAVRLRAPGLLGTEMRRR
jgi:hypothetical protein